MINMIKETAFNTLLALIALLATNLVKGKLLAGKVDRSAMNIVGL